ncbi:MAG: hypothetical protein AB1756_00330 [Acidobacteriota bacterium]
MRKGIFILFVMILLPVLSCEEGNVSDTGDLLIYVNAEPDFILAGNGSNLPGAEYGATTVTARVVNSSFVPMQGIGVLFTANPVGTEGGFQSDGHPIKTDSEGRATDILINDRSTTITVQSGSATATLTIPYVLENEPPTARIITEPNPVEVNRNAVFDGTTSGDVDGTITNYKWEFWYDHQCDIGVIPDRPDPMLDPPSETLEGSDISMFVKSFDHAQTMIVFLTVTDNNLATDDAGHCQEVVSSVP